jgi:hypothetical protein
MVTMEPVRPDEQATLALREVIEIVRLLLGENVGQRAEASTLARTDPPVLVKNDPRYDSGSSS